MNASAEAEDKVNMVPLIDCMFFLILFFLLVTKFTPDERAIASVLPTTAGGVAGPATLVQVPPINIAIYPDGVERGQGVGECLAALDRVCASGDFDRSARIRIGGAQPLLIRGDLLAAEASDAMRAEMSALHAYVSAELAKREEDGQPRAKQHGVLVSCFSGLSWKYALLAYDAVRAYERDRAHGRINRTVADLADAREVTFAPPLVRNFRPNELGWELEHIVMLP